MKRTCNSGYKNEVKPGYKKVCCRLGKNAGGVIRVIAIAALLIALTVMMIVLGVEPDKIPAIVGTIPVR
jgi:hypothetical protein